MKHLFSISNLSLIELGDKIVNHGGPAPIILEIRDVSARLLIQVVEQVPGILGDDKDLAAFHLGGEEGLPFVEEAAILLADKQIPKCAG